MRSLLPHAEPLKGGATADQAAVNHATADQFRVDQATADQLRFDHATADQFRVDQATADQLRIDQAAVASAAAADAEVRKSTVDLFVILMLDESIRRFVGLV